MTNNAPDYEDNLAFEPVKTAGTIEMVTKDGKAVAIRCYIDSQHYFDLALEDAPEKMDWFDVKIWWADLGNEKIEPAMVDEYGYLFGLDGCFYSPERCEYVKILAPCDYDHFVELTEKVEKLNDRVEWEIGKNNALEKQLIEAREEIKRGREALGLMCDCNDELLGVLKKCKEKIHEEFINQDIVSIDISINF